MSFDDSGIAFSAGGGEGGFEERFFPSLSLSFFRLFMSPSRIWSARNWFVLPPPTYTKGSCLHAPLERIASHLAKFVLRDFAQSGPQADLGVVYREDPPNLQVSLVQIKANFSHLSTFQARRSTWQGTLATCARPSSRRARWASSCAGITRPRPPPPPPPAATTAPPRRPPPPPPQTSTGGGSYCWPPSE